MTKNDLEITVDIEFPEQDDAKRAGEQKEAKEYPPTYTFQKTTGLGSRYVLVDTIRWYR